jgi:hypothetical protein
MKKVFFIGATVLFISGAFAFNVNNSISTSDKGCGICGTKQCTSQPSSCCGNGSCCDTGCCKK